MNKQPLPWRSVLLAPLASAPAAAIAGLGSSDGGFGSDLSWGLFFGIILGIPVSYVGMLFIGVPVYFVLRRLELLRLWIFVALGGLMPLLIFIVGAPIRTTLMSVAAGIAVGASAYFLLPGNSLPSLGNGGGSDV